MKSKRGCGHTFGKFCQVAEKKAENPWGKKNNMAVLSTAYWGHQYQTVTVNLGMMSPVSIGKPKCHIVE